MMNGLISSLLLAVDVDIVYGVRSGDVVAAAIAVVAVAVVAVAVVVILCNQCAIVTFSVSNGNRFNPHGTPATDMFGLGWLVE